MLYLKMIQKGSPVTKNVSRDLIDQAYLLTKLTSRLKLDVEMIHSGRLKMLDSSYSSQAPNKWND